MIIKINSSYKTIRFNFKFFVFYLFDELMGSGVSTIPGLPLCENFKVYSCCNYI